MKNYHLPKKPLIICALAVLISGVLTGCQDDMLTTETESNVVTLKSTKKVNYMIMSKSEMLPGELLDELSDYGKIIRTIPEIGVAVVSPQVANFETKVGRLSGVRSVTADLTAHWLEPESTYLMGSPESIGSDETYFGYLWGMDAIKAPEAWDAGVKGNNVKVFILDSGIDEGHPDLAPNLDTLLSTSFVPDEDYKVQPGLYFNHGSHVAGIVAAADNGMGVIGVAPEADIVAVKVLSEYTGNGAFSWINAGIVYAANNGADVINMSLGASLNKNGSYLDENGVWQKVPAVYIQEIILAQQRAVNYAYKKGAVIVCSAGNGGASYDGNKSIIKLPGELQNVITVSATAPNYWYYDIYNGITPDLDIAASYTDYGVSLVDIAAPGGDFDYEGLPYYYMDAVLSTVSEGYSFSAGTSMASPHVAGVAALIISNNPEMDNSKVVKQLLKTADKIDEDGAPVFFGKGRVNAYRAITE